MIAGPQTNQTIEKVIKFLVHHFEKSGHNPKPVILHSIEVALYLRQLNYPQKIIIGALLHDILEDTEVSAKEIQTMFGQEICQIVETLTFDPKIVDRDEKAKKEIDKCLKYGKDAVIIKAADFLKNIDYYIFAQNKAEKEYLLGKVKYFLDSSQNIIHTETPWIELSSRYAEILDTARMTAGETASLHSQ